MNHTAIAQWFPGDGGGKALWSTAIVVVAVGISWLAERAITRSARRVAALQKKDEFETKAFIGRTKPARLFLRLTVVLLSIISLALLWDLDRAFAGLLAGAGFAGLIIGLAAKDLVTDIVSGFLIFSKAPFDIGDWVEVNGIQGIVDDVTLGATTIITFDNEKVTIPNRLVEQNPIRNFSQLRRLRLTIDVPVRYGSHVGRALQIMTEVGRADGRLLETPEPVAYARRFDANGLMLQLRVWGRPMRSNLSQIRNDIIHEVHDRLRAEGIEVAVPHMQMVQRPIWDDAWTRPDAEP